MKEKIFHRVLRHTLGISYPLMRDLSFKLTGKDPEDAHQLMVKYSALFRILPVAPLSASEIEISNASGMNKNADIEPGFFRWCGFDRIVIGTVTLNPRQGNPRPRTLRLPGISSMINNMGLPNLGAQAVAENLDRLGSDQLPVTLSVSNDPDTPSGRKAEELSKLMRCFAETDVIDRVELNISCPNVEHAESTDTETFRANFRDSLEAISGKRKIYIKLSPTMSDGQIVDMLEDTAGKGIGFVISNTVKNMEATTFNRSKVPAVPGGVSGKIMYEFGEKLRAGFLDKGADPSSIIACGGIDSERKILHSRKQGISEFQLYTPFIYGGPDLIYRLRKARYD